MSILHPTTIAAATVLAVSGVCPGQEQLPFYVGRQVCRECHRPENPAGACTLKPFPPCGQSYGALEDPEAVHIAALSGVNEPPTRSRICLGCHATAADAGPRWTAETFDITDGVQCEACHTAGSLHVDTHRMRDPDRAQRTLGRLPFVDRSICVSCHRDRPSHREVLEAGWRRPEADAHYRTPVNLVPSPDGGLLYVVCTNSNHLLVVDPARAEVLDEIAVGRRPQDVAVSPGGDRLYVTNRFDSSVSVIDARTRTVVTEIAVGDEPHGVLTDSSGRTLYVLNTGQDSISVIDARDLTEVKRLAAGGGPWSLALRPDGETLYVTSVRPQPARFREPPHSEVTVVGTGHGAFVIDRPVAAEANMLEGIAWVPSRDVALFTLMRTKSLVPITRLAQGWSITNGLGILWPDGRIDQVLLDEPAASFPDPEDVAVSPDGRHALVTSGGSDHVALVDVEKLLATVTSATEQERRDVLPHHMGMSRRFVLKRIAVGSNPRGVAFSPDGRFAYVVNALDDTVTVIDTAGFNVVGAIDLGGPEQVTETRRGEKLFHSADITYGRQFSCRTCHPDGHINGLPFDIEAEGVGMHPVDNRTLRGILDTGPFKWEGTNPSLKRQCGPRLAVFFTRLNPYTPTELDALTHYIATIERPPNRYRRPEGLTPAQRRGKAIFERTRTNDGRPILPVRRCITCHNSAYRSSATTANVGSTMWFDAPIRAADIDMSDVYADPGQLGEMGAYFFTETSFIRRAFDTPHLNNIYDSAPYLHNGAAPTLEEIWTRFDQLMLHGETDDLSRQQFNDLIAYLKSL
ncbi:MAG: beta-propeller fold lactonase family protein [Planctomycetota bacterium]|jgi:YVTN family beta-propeller protein